jgi:hypothetical protein
MITREQCRGCEDDYYNSSATSSSGRCWNAASGKTKLRYRIGTWTEPTVPNAFTEEMRPSCFHRKGVSFYDKLPSFVKAEDVVRLADRKEVARG